MAKGHSRKPVVKTERNDSIYMPGNYVDEAYYVGKVDSDGEIWFTVGQVDARAIKDGDGWEDTYESKGGMYIGRNELVDMITVLSYRLKQLDDGEWKRRGF